MSAEEEHVVQIPKRPIAPRLVDGAKKPHVGPHYDAYKEAHAETVGHESDQWWADVCMHYQSCHLVADLRTES